MKRARRNLVKNVAIGIAAILAITATEASAANTETTTIHVSYAPAHYKALYENLTQKFMKTHPKIHVSLNASAKNYDELAQQTLRQNITNQMPDVSFQGMNQVRVFVDRGLAVPLDKFIAAETDWKGQGYTPTITSLAKFQGKVYGLPFGISIPVIFYNADLLKKAGSDVKYLPKSWDDVFKLGKKIDALGNNVHGFYMEYTNNAWSFETYVGSFGGSMMSPDEKTIAFDGSAGIATMKLLQKFGQEGQPHLGRDQGRQAFDAGTIGMLYSASSAYNRHKNAAKGNFALKVGPFPISSPKARFPAAGAAAVMFSSDVKKQKAAWEFIKFATSPAGQKVMLANTGYTSVNSQISGNPEIVDTLYPENPEFIEATSPLLSKLIGWYAFPRNNSEIINAIEDASLDVITLKTAPTVALNSLSEKVKTLLK